MPQMAVILVLYSAIICYITWLSSVVRWGFVCDDGVDAQKIGQVVCRNLNSNFVSAILEVPYPSSK